MVAQQLDPLVHVHHLKERGDVAQLMEMLGAREPSVRAAAARSLGALEARASQRRLVGLLEDSSGDVRRSALISLGEIKADEAVEELVLRLREAPESSERWHAAVALGRIGDARAVGPLVEALTDRRARNAATEALGRIGGDEALGALRAQRVPVWRWLVADKRREAIGRIERAQAEASGVVRAPLVPVGRECGLAAAASLACVGVLIVVAVTLLGADLGITVAFAAVATLASGAWRLWRAGPLAGEQWLPRARPLPSPSPGFEPALRTTARRAGSALVTLTVDLVIVWLASYVVAPEIAVGVLAAASGWVVHLRESTWLLQWQRRHSEVLLRERDPGSWKHHRYFLAARGRPH